MRTRQQRAPRLVHSTETAPLPVLKIDTAELRLFVGRSATAMLWAEAMTELDGRQPYDTHEYLASRCQLLTANRDFFWIWPTSFGEDPDRLVRMDYYQSGVRLAHMQNERSSLEQPVVNHGYALDKAGIPVLGTIASLQYFLGQQLG